MEKEQDDVSYFIEQTEKLKSIVESLKIKEEKAEEHATDLKAFQKALLENKARIDMLDASFKELSKKVDSMHEFVEKFKLLEAILEDAKRIDQKLRALEESREEVEITAQRLQKMCSDFQNTLKELLALKNELENKKKEFYDTLKLLKA